MKVTFRDQQATFLQSECQKMPKLRTFILFKDFYSDPLYLTKPLSFFQRRMLAKVRLGCLPVRLETGRYCIPRLPENKRTCVLCDDHLYDVGQLVPVARQTHHGCHQEADQVAGPIESEEHFLFHCFAFNKDRAQWFRKLNLPPSLNTLDLDNKLDLVLNNPQNVKSTSTFILTAIIFSVNFVYFISFSKISYNWFVIT